ncbi:diguanylate cyclase, partial [Citrobacter werkmanii]
IIISGQLVHITVTGGLTRVEAHEELHSVIARADNAMYYGKNNGRNCCVTVMADGEPSRISR